MVYAIAFNIFALSYAIVIESSLGSTRLQTRIVGATSDESYMLNVLCLMIAFVAAWFILIRINKPIETNGDEAFDNVALSQYWETTRNISRSNNENILNAVNVKNRTRERFDASNDCAANVRYCSTAYDCSILCTAFKYTWFDCDVDTNTCVPKPMVNDDGDDDDDDNDEDAPKKCDSKNGEFAVLVGIATIGTAVWQCVQLYKHFSDRTTFCENGRFDMDADVREPSYRDCECPQNTVRVIHSTVSSYDNALPHCVAFDKWDLLKDSMTLV